MAIKNYTSGVDIYTSLGEIQGALARAGATKIMVDYEPGKPTAVTFAIETVAGTRGFRLPAAVDGTLRVFAAQKMQGNGPYLRCLRHGGGAGRHDGGSAAADRMGYRLRAGELAHEAALLRRSVGA